MTAPLTRAKQHIWEQLCKPTQTTLLHSTLFLQQDLQLAVEKPQSEYTETKAGFKTILITAAQMDLQNTNNKNLIQLELC